MVDDLSLNSLSIGLSGICSASWICSWLIVGWAGLSLFLKNRYAEIDVDSSAAIVPSTIIAGSMY